MSEKIQQPGFLLRMLKRFDALVYEYKDPDGSIPQSEKFKLTASYIGLLGTLLVGAGNSFYILQNRKENFNIEKEKRFLRQKKALSLSSLIMLGLLVYQSYVIYNCVPQSRYTMIQEQRYKEVLSKRKEFLEQYGKKS